MKPYTRENLPDSDSHNTKNVSCYAEIAAGLERNRNFGEAAWWWRIAADAARSNGTGVSAGPDSAGNVMGLPGCVM